MRKPLLQVIEPNGNDVIPKLKGLWTSVTVSDHAGKKSDSATIVTVGPPRRVQLPRKGDRYTILMGWEDEGLVLQGSYTVQKIRPSGYPRGSGELVSIELRAADFIDKLKGGGREHFDDKTLGDILKTIGGRAGAQAVVDPALAAIKIPYALRWDQSLIDFATELVEQNGGTMKAADGKLVAMKRGGSTSGGGSALEPIVIRYADCMSYDADIDPRPAVGKVAASWQDTASGERKHATAQTGFDGPLTVLPTVYRSEAEAKKAAEAEGYETGNRTGSANFKTAGLPRARAEAPVTVEDFGYPLDGPWKAESVEKTITAKGGFLTDTHVTAGKDKKGSK